MSLAETLTQYRIEKGYTKSQLAMLVGVSEPTISRLENGKIKSIKSDKLILFAQALDVSVDKLLSKK